MMQPAVSVVIAVYNGERFIGAAIDSVLNQTLTNFELIVVDDGSTDQTPAILASYDDARLTILSPGRQGVSAAVNHGLARSRADLVARLDGDDVMEPNRLARQVAFMGEHPDLAGAASYYWIIDENGAEIGSADPPLHTVEEVNRHVKNGGRLLYPHPTVIFRKSDVLALGGYDPVYASVEDVDLFMRMFDAGRPLVFQPERLTRFRVHAKSTTATQGRRQFFLMTNVFENHARARQGLPRRTMAEFLDATRRDPLTRLFYEIQVASHLLRRRAQEFEFAGAKLLAAAVLALAGLLNPWASLSFLKRRLLRSIAAERSSAADDVAKARV